MFPWLYFPVVFSKNDHPIVKNLDAVSFKFANSVDTVKAPGIHKTILLSGSQYGQSPKAPVRLHFSSLNTKPDHAQFSQKHIPLAVLLEGEFTSVFKNRIAKQTMTMIDTLPNINYRDKSVATKMIVIGDGDVIRNGFDKRGNPTPLGYDRYSEHTFSNSDFILNCVEYLLDNSGIIETRNKEIKLRLLDRKRVAEEKTRWQTINLAVPVVLIIFFGLGYNYLRRRRYVGR